MASNDPTSMERFVRGILPENPVFRAVLGTCPTLAVTNGVAPALTMGLSVLAVMICSNVMTSLIRGLLKPHLRILVFTLTIATFVTIVDKMLAAYLYSMSKALGPYIPLIIVNCIIICRCEVCAAKQGPVVATFDALGQGIGFTLALLAMATVRELLGSGSWLGFQVFPAEPAKAVWAYWAVMILPPGAFLTFGLLMGLVNLLANRKKALAAN